MSRFYRLLFHVFLVKPLLTLILGVNLYGKRHIPINRQFIMVANHNSHLDTLALLNLFPPGQLQDIQPVAAEDYFTANRFRAWISQTFFNVLPIPRTGITKANNPVCRMAEAIRGGKSLIVFPEGSRGKPEEMAHFQTGIAHLIQKFPALPVVPVYLKGLGRVLPKGEFILVPFFCDVRVGEPLFLSGPKDAITAALEEAVSALARQD